MKPILLTVAGNPENQDRGLILQDGRNHIMCVADGAGGRSGAAEAATLAAQWVRKNASAIGNAEACVELLRAIDEAIANDAVAGETTCALAVITPAEIYGASVGDSGAWLIPDSGNYVDLTLGQQRKPFIGSGSAWPVSFHCPTQIGSVLVATDGLLKYTSAERIMDTCRLPSTEVAAQRLIDLVRYPTGALPDDVTLILTKL